VENAKRAQERLIAKGYPIVADGDFGARSFAALMCHVGGRPAVAELQKKLGEAAAKHFPAAGLTTALRVAHALAQQSVETGGFGRLVESLNYSVAGLRATFSKARISDAECQSLGRKAGAPPLTAAQQEKIANLVYGGAWGLKNLGNSQAGDGWKFRGRGAKQTTGRSNYGDVKTVTQIDVIDNPELLEDPDMGMRAACIFWKNKNCNHWADLDKIDQLTVAINGGTNGLPERKAALVRARAILL
jgi:putative chitinase